MTDPRRFDSVSVRLSTYSGTDLITIECLQPGCGWTRSFVFGAQYLSKIVEACAQHPCRVSAADGVSAVVPARPR